MQLPPAHSRVPQPEVALCDVPHLPRTSSSRGPGALRPRGVPRVPWLSEAAAVPHVPGGDRIDQSWAFHGLSILSPVGWWARSSWDDFA